MPLQLLLLPPARATPAPSRIGTTGKVCKILGVRLNIDGEVAEEQGVLSSPIMCRGSTSPCSAVAPVSFVAKQEVASWPFVSWLAKAAFGVRRPQPA